MSEAFNISLKDEEWKRNKYYNKRGFFLHKKMKAKEQPIKVEDELRGLGDFFFSTIKPKIEWLKTIQETTRKDETG